MGLLHDTDPDAEERLEKFLKERGFSIRQENYAAARTA
jgi:hypothetical protein